MADLPMSATKPVAGALAGGVKLRPDLHVSRDEADRTFSVTDPKTDTEMHFSGAEYSLFEALAEGHPLKQGTELQTFNDRLMAAGFLDMEPAAVEESPESVAADGKSQRASIRVVPRALARRAATRIAPSTQVPIAEPIAENGASLGERAVGAGDRASSRVTPRRRRASTQPSPDSEGATAGTQPSVEIRQVEVPGTEREPITSAGMAIAAPVTASDDLAAKLASLKHAVDGLTDPDEMFEGPVALVPRPPVSEQNPGEIAPPTPRNAGIEVAADVQMEDSPQPASLPASEQRHSTSDAQSERITPKRSVRAGNIRRGAVKLRDNVESSAVAPDVDAPNLERSVMVSSRVTPRQRRASAQPLPAPEIALATVEQRDVESPQVDAPSGEIERSISSNIAGTEAPEPVAADEMIHGPATARSQQGETQSVSDQTEFSPPEMILDADIDLASDVLTEDKSLPASLPAPAQRRSKSDAKSERITPKQPMRTGEIRRSARAGGEKRRDKLGRSDIATDVDASKGMVAQSTPVPAGALTRQVERGSSSSQFDADSVLDMDDDMFAAGPSLTRGRGGGALRKLLAGGGGLDGALAGGGFGGMGGGGGLGGLGGGGFDGGGMGGGGGGREALLAALAGRRGARGQEPERAPSDRVSLFNPTLLFDLLGILFWPFHFLHWLLWPTLFFAGAVVYQHWTLFTHDLSALAWNWSTVASALISLFIVNFTARLAQGAVIRNCGGEVRQFGIVVEMGILPRFFIDKSAIATLDRSGQLWAYGSPLTARLWLFAGGTILWAMVHGSGSSFSDYALVIAQAALVEFLIIAFPLMPADGMGWMTTWFGEPNLKKKAIASLRAWLTGRPRPAIVRPEQEKALIFFGIGAVLCSLLFVLALLTYFAISLEVELGGAGMGIFLVLLVSCIVWFIGMWSSGRHTPWVMEGAAAGLAGDGATEAAAEKARTNVAAWARVFWAVLLVFLLGVAFLPYNYDASGQFNILPTALNQASARTDGEIVKILVREGDWVKENQILGQLSSWDQQHEVAVNRARLSEAQAKLAQLIEGAKAEQIEVAEKEVESARASVAFSEAEMKRQAELEKTGTASTANSERAKSKYDTDVAALAVAIANLDLVRSSATKSEIDARKADVDRLTAELKYSEDLLERTNMRAPADGRVITPNLHLLLGKWLRSGQPLLETENTKTVDAEIDVPESDISLIAPGDTVTIKAWGYSDRPIAGTVVSVAPAAEKRSYGMVVRVKATIPNPEGTLKSSMTGYAKIEGAQMQTWQAFLRFIVRFFEVEVWSWIP